MPHKRPHLGRQPTDRREVQVGAQREAVGSSLDGAVEAGLAPVVEEGKVPMPPCLPAAMVSLARSRTLDEAEVAAVVVLQHGVEVGQLQALVRLDLLQGSPEWPPKPLRSARPGNYAVRLTRTRQRQVQCCASEDYTRYMLCLPLRWADKATEGQPRDAVEEHGLFRSLSAFRTVTLHCFSAMPVANRRLPFRSDLRLFSLLRRDRLRFFPTFGIAPFPLADWQGAARRTSQVECAVPVGEIDQLAGIGDQLVRVAQIQLVGSEEGSCICVVGTLVTLAMFEEMLGYSAGRGSE